MSARATDPGLSNERTALAWQRTALTLVVAAAILARLTLGSSGAGAAIVPVLAIVLGLWVFGESARRYLGAHRYRAGSRPRGGRAPTAMSMATVLLCVTEVVVLVAH